MQSTLMRIVFVLAVGLPMARPALIALALFAFVLPAESQEVQLSALQDGDRIRVTLRGRSPQTGVLVSMTDDGLFWRPSGPSQAPTPARLDLDRLTNLEKSVGEEARYGRTILITSGVMAAGMGIAGALVAKDEGGDCGDPSNPFSTPCSDSPAFGAAAGIASGALLGIPVGLLLATINKSDIWVPVEGGGLRPNLRVEPSGRLGLTLSLSLGR